jgi:hypothetical protein
VTDPAGEARDSRERRALRALLAALALSAAGLPGALPVDPPGALAGSDPLALAVWLALVAPACGAAAAALRSSPWPYAAVVPGAWALLLVAVDGGSERDLPTPAWAVLALAGLYYAGFAAGLAARRRAWLAAETALVVAAGLVALPLAPGAIGSPWPPAIAAATLDLSPATLVAECAGVDWMRHPAVYAAAGTDRLERPSYAAELAGPAALLVGCALCALAARSARAARA